MAERNAYPAYPAPPTYPAEPWRSPAHGAPPPMGYTPGQVHYMQPPYAHGHMPVNIVAMGHQSNEVSQIRDWLPWSIVNFFVGWGLGGILPLVFSLICRSNKQANNVQGARSMSLLALIFNILVTIGGLIGWIYLIVALAIIGSVYSNCSVYPYCR
jgi:hypothetical protein